MQNLDCTDEAATVVGSNENSGYSSSIVEESDVDDVILFPYVIFNAG